MGSFDSVWLLTSKNTLETIQNTLATAQKHTKNNLEHLRNPSLMARFFAQIYIWKCTKSTYFPVLFAADNAADVTHLQAMDLPTECSELWSS